MMTYDSSHTSSSGVCLWMSTHFICALPGSQKSAIETVSAEIAHPQHSACTPSMAAQWHHFEHMKLYCLICACHENPAADSGAFDLIKKLSRSVAYSSRAEHTCELQLSVTALCMTTACCKDLTGAGPWHLIEKTLEKPFEAAQDCGQPVSQAESRFACQHVQTK